MVSGLNYGLLAASGVNSVLLAGFGLDSGLLAGSGLVLKLLAAFWAGFWAPGGMLVSRNGAVFGRRLEREGDFMILHSIGFA